MALYDDYLYDEFPVRETHPAHLAAVARLFGLRPAPPQRCRVLELGCGLGGNLVPMACALPESTFVGVDLSAKQIAEGQVDVDALGLRNLTLRAMDILDVDASLGTFDYILCHGVISWVPPEVQVKILRVCAAQLAPEGVAFVSFNTYPGWHLRGMIRDMLRREVGPHGTPPERVARARAFLRFLALAPAAGNPARAWLAGELSLLDSLSDKYLFYEYLVDVNTPVYFADFAAAANRVGLAYVADAHLQTMARDRFGPEAAAEVAQRSRSVYDTEQHLDLLELRFFRRALLCREDLPLERTFAAERLEGLWISSPFEPVSTPEDLADGTALHFKSPFGAELATTAPIVKAALLALAEEGPRGLTLAALAARARARLDGAEPTAEDHARIGDDVLSLVVRGHLDLRAWVHPCVTQPGPRPVASPMARLQASRGRRGSTNLRHETVRTDGVDRALLRRMDGTRTVEELIDGVLADLTAGTVTMELNGEPTRDREVVQEVVEQKLPALGRRALLVA